MCRACICHLLRIGLPSGFRYEDAIVHLAEARSLYVKGLAIAWNLRPAEILHKKWT